MNSENASIEIADMLRADEDTAAIMLLMEVLRGSTRLRCWLWQEFLSSAQCRDRLAQCIDGAAPARLEGARLSAWLSGVEAAYADTRKQLRSRYAGRLVVPDYGGLDRTEIDQLMRRYRAGHPNFGPFFLLYAWRKHVGGHGNFRLRLLLASNRFLGGLMEAGGSASVHQLSKAHAYFSDWRGPTLQRGDYGFADWWKVSVLLYMRAHPKPRYRTSELGHHLRCQRLTVDPKDIRAFCKKHGIARDSRVGRPRKQRS